MTTGLTLLVLRFAFLAVLWLFVFVIVFALRSDLFGQRVRTIPTDPKAGCLRSDDPRDPDGGPAAASASAGAFTELIGQSPGPTQAPQPGWHATRHHRGLPRGHGDAARRRGPSTIGRSSESNVVIRDDYTSTNHARLELPRFRLGPQPTSTPRTAPSSTGRR